MSQSEGGNAMHSIIRQGQFHGQLHGQFKGQLSQTPPQGVFSHPGAHPTAHPGAHPSVDQVSQAARVLAGAEWERRSLVRGAPNAGRVDVCRLIVAMFGLALYLALPIAAVSFALNLVFG